MIPFSFMRAGSPAAPDFVATDIANCRAWYRASLGITDDGSGRASAWADQSGAGDANRNFGQATGGARPVITASSANFNGRQVLTFDGARDMATGTFSATYAQAVTIYMCFRQTAASNYFLFDDSDGTSRIALLDNAGSPASPYVHAGADLLGTGGDMPINTTHVLCIVANGASSAVYVSRYNTAAVSGNAGSNSLQSFKLGARFNDVNYMHGAVAELIAYSGAHNAATRQTAMQGIGNMYGVSVVA